VGLGAMRVLGGTEALITVPAAIIDPLPSVTPARIIAPAPIQTPSSTTMGALVTVPERFSSVPISWEVVMNFTS